MPNSLNKISQKRNFMEKKLGIFLLMKKSMKFLAYKRQGTTVVLLV